MAGDYTTRDSLLTRLNHNRTVLVTHINVILTVDVLDEARSGEDYGGVPQISGSYWPTYPPEVAVTGELDAAAATRNWILALAQMYTMARTYTMSRKGDGIAENVIGVRTNTNLTGNKITWAALQAYIGININLGEYIGDSNFNVMQSWQTMINNYANIHDGTFYYCHGSAPACHGSRGRR